MAKRPSLSANTAKADTAKKAATVAKAIAGKPATTPDAVEYETVSYNLPLHLIDLYRDLAAARHKIDQAAKREQRRRIKAGLEHPDTKPTQARQSASAVVREAMEAYADTVRKELDGLER